MSKATKLWIPDNSGGGVWEDHIKPQYYHVDFNSFVVDEKTMNKINKLYLQSQEKDFLKTLIDEGVLEIVSTDVADDGYEVDDLYQYLPKEKKDD
jgi:hypothetical protein